VSGTDGSSSNDKLNKMFFSVITTTSGLVTVDLMNFTYTAPNIAPVSGGVTKDNATNDIDSNGGYDYGSSNNTDASGWQCANWGFYTSGSGTKQKTIFLFSNAGNQKLATLSVTPMGTIDYLNSQAYADYLDAWQTWEDGGEVGPEPLPPPPPHPTLLGTGTDPHGITQIWAFGHTSDSDNIWMEDGHSTPLTYGTPQTGTMVTLYQVATAEAGGTVTVNTNQTGHFNGQGSIGTMDNEVWKARLQGSSGEWTTLGAGLSLDLSFAELMGLLGSAGVYDVELDTWYASAVVLPGNNASSDTTTLTLLPEPGTILFLLAGGAGLGLIRRRKGKK